MKYWSKDTWHNEGLQKSTNNNVKVFSTLHIMNTLLSSYFSTWNLRTKTEEYKYHTMKYGDKLPKFKMQKFSELKK